MTRISRIDRHEISRNWHWIDQLLGPVIGWGHGDPETVRDKLVSGEMGLVSLHGAGAGLVVIEPGRFDGKFCLWVPYVMGKATMGPKAFITMIRDMMGQFEDLARAAGCVEVRIGGRDYSRILPDYERFDGQPNRLRKVL